ncbi:MAG: hypothetical protein MUC91_06470 [Verrucomicrobia bacterium]|jgi:hypothetical protein|nr:hypothetical protein [Verrucomicrobiota bacterium]
MRAIPRIILICLICCSIHPNAWAATYSLEEGGTIIGDPLMSTASDAGVKIRMADGSYTNVSWGAFSQKDLKAFSKDEKLTEFVEPFIIITAEDKARMTEVDITEPLRLSHPPKGSLVGSLFQSGPGWLLVLLFIAANVYAGYEIAIFRARNHWLVAGLAAVPVLGTISNIIWLSLPTYIEREPEPTQEELAEIEAAQPEFKVPLAGEVAAAHEAALAAVEGREAGVPKDEVFPRGKFTFNKRFFETRFADFFGAIRRGEKKFNYIVFKTPKATIVADRITRASATEIHVNAVSGGTGEVSVAFAILQEVRLTAKA